MTATPFESNGRTTTLAEESDFLAALTTAAGGRLAVDVLGYSVNGAPIRLLRVGATVAPAYALSSSSTLWVGQQHGEEVQSREALLAWARDLAETTDPTLLAYLTAHPAFIMPTCNPDNLGVTAYNAAGVNLNRDHFKLSQPETRAIHAAINTIRPQIIHDMHTGGATDMDLRGSASAQVDPALKALALVLENAVRADLTALGIGNGQYPAEDFEPRMLRDAAGHRHAVGLLSEVRSSTGGPEDPTYGEQVGWCRETVRSVADWHAANADRVASTIRLAKMRQTADGAECRSGFDMGNTGTDLAVQPWAYRLTANEYAAASEVLDLLGIVATVAGDEYMVSMAQEAQPLIPYVLDPGSSEAAAVATPIVKPRPVTARTAGAVVVIGGLRCRVDRMSYVSGGSVIPQAVP